MVLQLLVKSKSDILLSADEPCICGVVNPTVLGVVDDGSPVVVVSQYMLSTGTGPAYLPTTPPVFELPVTLPVA